ncbi:MAG: stage V sporulation protein T [Firmicutes bacterium]|jgi:AbrB family transcriptional regulator (stage V sporulation protein T)|nr:stage V sporulation protein T [Bacillota bacterium]
MKATGIVRRIDDLGRIVIPKEIRRTMRIKERDALEIFTDRDGEVILKKYSPIANLEDFAQEYAESLFESTGHVSLILDRDTYIAVAGTSKKAFLGKPVDDEITDILEHRQPWSASLESAHKMPIPGFEDASQMIVPIIHEGDVVGAVILVSREKSLSELEQTLCQTAADFLAKQLG